jgi:DNA-directed RNA polymerase specialized sigma24 family protein
VGDAHDAEDEIQDALVPDYTQLDQFGATAKMTTRLTTIATNSALTQLRGRRCHLSLSWDE